jgi:hypothetical protein
MHQNTPPKLPEYPGAAADFHAYGLTDSDEGLGGI